MRITNHTKVIMKNSILNLIISVIITFLTALGAAHILKIKKNFLDLLVIGAAGTIFGFAISWLLTETGIAEFSLTTISTFLGSCIFIFIFQLIRNKK